MCLVGAQLAEANELKTRAREKKSVESNSELVIQLETQQRRARQFADERDNALGQVSAMEREIESQTQAIIQLCATVGI